MNRGFTIVEIVVTITIIGIMLGIAAISFSSSRVQARDNERQVAAENIATALEGNLVSDESADVNAPESGYGYPGAWALTYVLGEIDELDEVNYQKEGAALIRTGGPINSTVDTVSPRPNGDQPMTYVPVSSSGDSCALSPCRSFKIFYYQERDDSVHEIRSRRQ